MHLLPSKLLSSTPNLTTNTLRCSLQILKTVFNSSMRQLMPPMMRKDQFHVSQNSSTRLIQLVSHRFHRRLSTSSMPTFLVILTQTTGRSPTTSPQLLTSNNLRNCSPERMPQLDLRTWTFHSDKTAKPRKKNTRLLMKVKTSTQLTNTECLLMMVSTQLLLAYMMDPSKNPLLMP